MSSLVFDDRCRWIIQVLSQLQCQVQVIYVKKKIEGSEFLIFVWIIGIHFFILKRHLTFQNNFFQLIWNCGMNFFWKIDYQDIWLYTRRDLRAEYDSLVLYCLYCTMWCFGFRSETGIGIGIEIGSGINRYFFGIGIGIFICWLMELESEFLLFDKWN